MSSNDHFHRVPGEDSDHDVYPAFEIKRNRGGLIWHFVHAWYLPVLHLIVLLAVWYFMARYLPGKTFAIGRGDGDSTRPHGLLYQSDMTTVISVLVLGCRTLAGACQGVILWRCIFLLLEIKSLKFSEIRFLSEYHLPSLGTCKAYPKSFFVWTVVLIVILALPAQFSAPVVTGSVTWTPTYEFDSQQQSSSIFGKPTAGNEWTWYVDYQNVRSFVVQESAGLANMESYLIPNNSTDGRTIILAPPARRPTTQFRNLKNGTSIEQLTVPFINITSFEWIDYTELDLHLRQIVVNNITGYLNISQPDNPLLITLEGVAAPLKPTKWNQSSLDTSQLPEATVFHSIKHVALQLKHGNSHNGKFSCSSLTDTVFQSIDQSLLQYKYWNGELACFSIARMNITAGSFECESTSSNRSSCILSASSLAVESSETELSLDDVNQDSLIDEIFAMLPEVIALMVTTGGFTTAYTVHPEILTHSIDPELFLRNAITLGYQGSWSAFTERLGSESLALNYFDPVSILIVSVSQLRVTIWAGTHLLLTLSSLILWVLHNRSKSTRPVVVDYILSLLMLNNSAIPMNRKNLDDKRLKLITERGAGLTQDVLTYETDREYD
ncbi:hypothetical protein N7493_000555 [Penicillium malachiteum]|uniref:Uncharacterized protein n=1 Tax=Penicillium malachiteum TaxID=1324776 RepID=A0AAD6N0U2_9EURO|nr:hypothetical protein N7493_000555 [Penicillium malachiteum]